MRGKVIRALECAAIIRITPAYAGKSSVWSNIENATRDHPRLCGEKNGCSEKINSLTGSPPPMRGKVFVFLKFRPPTRDHPRLCGEKGSATEIVL